ncbi:MAG TPA: hypothetical protein VEQ85_05975 [Lacipirellulaceae bacterium]|nr:hypothetical protein [Lacipirellulaceae bacterium]
MDKKDAIVGGVAALLVLLLGAWWLGYFETEDVLVVKVRELAEQPQTDETREAFGEAMKARFEGIPEDQRRQVFEQMAPVLVPLMMSQMTSEIDRVLALPEAERNREIDKRIDEMTKGGRRPGGPRGGGPGGGGGNRDPKEMAERQKKFLSWTTPEQRASLQNGFQAFSDRMKERGMDPPPMPGGGFF